MLRLGLGLVLKEEEEEGAEGREEERRRRRRRVSLGSLQRREIERGGCDSLGAHMVLLIACSPLNLREIR